MIKKLMVFVTIVTTDGLANQFGKLKVTHLTAIKAANCFIDFSQQAHQSNQLSRNQLLTLSALSDQKYTELILDNILIPRVVGTPNHEKVNNYIRNELDALGWTVDVDEFVQRAPQFGQLTFKNIVATPHPNAERHLVLACHYDSKHFPKRVHFVGATDSAVPCAMILNLARTLNDLLKSHQTNDVGLKVVFFDGEEAFVNWGPNDSIYGAKHLANLMAKNVTQSKSTGENVTMLERIDMLILLDLLGTSTPSFYSFFPETERWYLEMANHEYALSQLGLLRKHSRNNPYFKGQRSAAAIEDDHTPFVQKNVPILHLISWPFPDEWHTARDNRSILDPDAIENLNKILRVFVAEYLNLKMPDPPDDDNRLDKEL